jgi:CDP-glycerol glycerophosphotransferase
MFLQFIISFRFHSLFNSREEINSIMEEFDLRNKQLKHLEIEDVFNHVIFIIEASFLQSSLRDVDYLKFVLYERGTDNKISFPAKVVGDSGEWAFVRGELNYSQNVQAFKESDIWDLYLEKYIADEEKKIRIKSSREDIRLYSVIDIDNNEMFIPYTTKKGNVSFRTKEISLLSKIENIELKNDGRMDFSGYAVYYPSAARKVQNKELNLIISNNLDEGEIKVPLKLEKRKDLTSKYGRGIFNLDQSGFEGSIDIKSLINGADNKYLKFHIELNVNDKGKEKMIKSNRLKFIPIDLKSQFQSTFIHINGTKMKIRIKPTKKSKYLSVRAFNYNTLKEIKHKIKSKLLKIKRSKKVKNLYKNVFKLVGMLPAKRNLIVFESFLGKQYSDNPKAIYDYMRINHPNYEMYWSVDPRYSSIFEGKGLKTIRRFSIPWLLKMARAKYWVSNSRLPLWIPKPSHTTYLQTWHGTPLKRLAADMEEVHMPGTNTRKYKENFLKESSRWDYLISPNRYSSEIFARAFGFEKEMIESGYPRNDFLHTNNNEEAILKLKERLNLPLDKKVILYAPTWRDNEFYQKGKYKFNLKLDLERMRKELGEEYIILLRMHYLIAENLDITSYSGFAYDVSHHTDISELYLISDLLITDYSSVFFDYANLKRPMIFFVYDIENYRDTLRGFYFDFESKAPGPLVKTTEEVVDQIKNQDNLLNENFTAFYNKFCYLEKGESSKRVVKKVFN